MRTKRLFLVSFVAILVPLVASCGAASGGEAAGSGDIVVFAASSLTDAFTDLAAAFNVVNPDAKVTFNFSGSSELVTQISQGAPADVFVSADDTNMKKLAAAGEVAGDPVASLAWPIWPSPALWSCCVQRPCHAAKVQRRS